MSIWSKCWWLFGGGKSGAFGSAKESTKRSLVPSFQVNTHVEYDKVSRYELLQKTHWAYNSIPMITGAIDKVTRAIVRQGLAATAQTGDPVFDKKATQYFGTWAGSKELSDVSERRSFYERQLDAASGMFIDGDCFFHKSKNSKLQFIEASQVGYIPDNAISEIVNDEFIDGLKIDDFGKVTAYSINVRNLPSGCLKKDSYKTIDSKFIIQLMKFSRGTQLRGMSILFSSLNTIVDIADICALTKENIKLDATFAVLINRSQGGAGAKITEEYGNEKANNSDDPTAVGDGRDPNLERIFGSAISYLGIDEQAQNIKSERPNPNLIPFLDYLQRSVATAMGLPLEYIWDVSDLGGANTRYMLQEVDATLNFYRDYLIENLCKPVYKWVISNAIKNGDLPSPKIEEGSGKNYWDAKWFSPGRSSVDYRGDSKADLALVQNHLMSQAEWHESRGQDADSQMELIFSEMKKEVDLSEKHKVDLAHYRENYQFQTVDNSQLSENSQNQDA